MRWRIEKGDVLGWNPSCGIPPRQRQEPVYATKTTPIPHSSPIILPIVQPSLAANSATDVTSTIIPIILTSMQKIQQLMVQMKANQSGGGGQTRNRNTRFPPTIQEATEPRQVQPHKPLLYFATKYFWTHGKCEGDRCCGCWFVLLLLIGWPASVPSVVASSAFWLKDEG